MCSVVAHPDLAGVPILVMVNKVDAPHALSAEEVQEALDLPSMPGGTREWAVCACSALTGEGVLSGVEWLVNAVARARERMGLGDDAGIVRAVVRAASPEPR